MQRLARTLALLGLLSLGCDQKREGPMRHVELRTLSGNRVELVPAEGKPPYCLAFSVAERARPAAHHESGKRVLGLPAGKARRRRAVSNPQRGGESASTSLLDDRLRANSVASRWAS